MSCGEDKVHQAVEPPEDVEQELSEFSLVRMIEGRTKWTLKSDSATFLESNIVRIGKAELVIFGEKEGEKTTVYADQGEVNQRTYDIKMKGNVKAVYSDGSNLTTDELYWQDRANRMYTLPGVKVTINYEDSVIVGEELEADPGLEVASLKKVIGITRVEEEESEE
jgi:LPS export ABC transporter protein LptC